MLQHFKEPKDFENHLYLSQLLQAEGVKIAMEAHRKNKPLNMGSLIWQLNDCWPGASWSSIDYYGKWKALHYYIRSAFNEVIVTFEDDEDEVRAYMISDRTEDIKATLYLTIMDMNGKKINSYEKKVKLKANGSDLVWKSNKKDLLKKAKKEDAILRSRLVFNDEVLHENQYLFVRHKNLKINDPAIDFEFKEEGGKLLVALKSNKAAFGVTFKHSGLDLQFSDNYFTLFPKEQKIIEIISKESISEIKNKLTVKSLYDSYASK
jgi:beta-mannosidase